MKVYPEHRAKKNPECWLGTYQNEEFISNPERGKCIFQFLLPGPTPV